MNNVVEFTKNILIDEIYNYEGAETLGCNLGFLLLEKYNNDNTLTNSIGKSKKWIIENFDELGEIVDYITISLDLKNELHNAFLNPDLFQLQIVQCVANKIIEELPIMEKLFDEYFTITQEVGNRIIEEIESIDYELF